MGLNKLNIGVLFSGKWGLFNCSSTNFPNSVHNDSSTKRKQPHQQINKSYK